MMTELNDNKNSISRTGPVPANKSETLLWIALVALALVFRLADLAAAPLNAVEAGQALAAFHAARGEPGLSLPIGYNPLLFHANTLLFALFAGGDGLARLVPALAGVGLVLVPLLLRRHLGKWGALGMGLVLAFSPTALFLSRTVDGAVPATLGIALLVACAVRYHDTQRPRFAVLAGLGLAVALSAGETVWGLIAGLLVGLAGTLWVWWDQAGRFWSRMRPAVGRGLTAMLVGLLIVGTGLGLHIAGLSAIGEQLYAWVNRFRAAAGTVSPSALVLLAAYEPLAMVAGLAGLILAIKQRHKLGLLWGLWTFAGLLEFALMPGREPADLLWVLLPLAGLSGLTVRELARSLRRHGRWLNEGLYLPISLALWAHCGVVLARHAHGGRWADLALAGMTVLLQVLLTTAFGFAIATPALEAQPSRATAQGMAASLRAGGLSLGLVLLLISASIGWGLTHVRPADPRELLVQAPAAVELETLVRVVEQVSASQGRSAEARAITLLGDVDPSLTWALRQFDLRAVERLEPDETPLMVVAGLDQIPPFGYFGEIFALERAWTPVGLTCAGWPPECRNLARWWLYRSAPEPPVVSRQFALWVRGNQDLVSP